MYDTILDFVKRAVRSDYISYCAAHNNVGLWISITNSKTEKTKGIIPSWDGNVNIVSVEIQKQ